MMPQPRPNPRRPDLKHQRVIVTGAQGQLGRQLCRILGPRSVPLDVATLDLTDQARTESTLRRIQPDLLINCAAYTAVDAAESDVDRCLAVNCGAVQTLVDVTRSLLCPIVQISTDYVFGAPRPPIRPYQERDPISPHGVYARSKAQSENIVAEHPEHLIVRTSGLYGPRVSESADNFVNTMLRLGRTRSRIRVVDDQICCPTYVLELAEAIVYLISIQRRGLLHVVSDGALSWFEFAREIFRLRQLDCEIEPVTSEEYAAVAPRPCYSALDIGQYKQTQGPPMSSPHCAVARYLASRTAPPA